MYYRFTQYLGGPMSCLFTLFFLFQNNDILEMHEDTFCNVKNLTYVRKALEDIRLDGNPINLSRTPQAYMCLPRLPIGSFI